MKAPTLDVGIAKAIDNEATQLDWFDAIARLLVKKEVISVDELGSELIAIIQARRMRKDFAA